MAHILLSDGEWKLMNRLWEDSPATITQLTERLAGETGWGKHTIITMLGRLEKKGAVAHRENGSVIEEGTHRQLMQQQGKYYQMFSTQAKRYRE